ncbi:MAG: acetyl-CoA carboxylase carboxyltransferase component [Limisphaerales bacterium]|jgi:acetyl-CoA carboxylase carboxyltransferase component
MQDDLIEQIEAARRAGLDAARSAAVDGVHAKGKLTARERLALLLDPDSFTEFGGLAGKTTKVDDAVAADGLVSGVGDVVGRPVVVASYDVSADGGRQSDRNLRKLSKLLYLAVEHRWPFVCFVDGGGARDDQPLVPPPIAVTPRGRFDLLDGLAELNGWAPSIAIVSGECNEGHSAIAMLADFTVATDGSSISAHGGPSIPVKDYAKSGDLDLIVADEAQAIQATRRYLELYLHPVITEFEIAQDALQIADLIPENRRRPYDMRGVMNALVDKDSALELAPAWGRSMLTALARIAGRAVGIYANQPKSPLAGAIDAAAADKAARFVELCDAYELPIVSLIDNPGYMVGPKAEREGIARHHARPLAALHHRSVPLYAVQIRKAYGLGPYAMSGWGSAQRMPDLRLAWPSVESGGMSLEGAAYLVKRKEIHAAKNSADAMAIRDAYAEKMRDANSGLRAGRSYQFDDVIAPNETRPRLIAMLQRLPLRDMHPTAADGGVKKHTIDLR